MQNIARCCNQLILWIFLTKPAPVLSPIHSNVFSLSVLIYFSLAQLFILRVNKSYPVK